MRRFPQLDFSSGDGDDDMDKAAGAEDTIRRWGNMRAMGDGNDEDDMSRLDEQDEVMIDDEYDSGTDGNNGVRIRDAIARRRDKTRNETIDNENETDDETSKRDGERDEDDMGYDDMSDEG